MVDIQTRGRVAALRARKRICIRIALSSCLRPWSEAGRERFNDAIPREAWQHDRLGLPRRADEGSDEFASSKAGPHLPVPVRGKPIEAE
jgi:hypothetical protein